jgi:poly(hydroxyalkanoate) depolymerase family esterase
MLHRNIHMSEAAISSLEFPMASLGRTVALLQARRGQDQIGRDARLAEIVGFGSNPGRLRMTLYVPKTRLPRAGLVVVLHGCTQTAAGYAAPAGWLDLADRFGFVVLAPEQQRGNNPTLCFNWHQAEDIARRGGEAESIAEMVSHALGAFDLDAGRVFITGFSAGGAMTAVLLATYPEVFAGGAIIAGLPYGVATSLGEALSAMSMPAPPAAGRLGDHVRRATAHAGPWPTVSVWHGQADGVVRPVAGAAAAAQWRDVHGVNAPPERTQTSGGREFLVWRTPAGRPVVEWHGIPGLAHGAPVHTHGPQACGSASQYTPEMGISSSFEIAAGWGLLGDASSGGIEAAAAQRPESWNDAGQPAGVRSGADFINDALRAAGLMR